MRSSLAALRGRLPELALCASILVFLALGFRLAGELPSWHEIVSALPNNATRVLAPGPGRGDPPVLEPSCAGPGAPLLAISSTRPHLALCVGGQALPVMVTPYASGVSTWPLALLHGVHHDDTFALRRLWLCVAALSLVLTFRLVSRVASRPAAALVSVLTATSSPFLLMNALLLPFETVPCTLVVAALSVWSGCPALAPGAPPEAPARPARLVLGAALAGLALATNVKAIFLLAPLAALAWRSGVRLRKIRPRHAAAMLAALALPLVPMVIFARVDPLHGFEQQVGTRAALALDNLRLGRLVSEPVLLLNFASDVMSYVELAARRSGVRVTWVLFAVAVPLLHCVVAGVARLAGRAYGSVIAAACGVVILVYFLVSMLLYKQYPGGNYAPLHDVFGIAMAAGVLDLAEAARRALDRRDHGGPGALVMASIAGAILAGGGLWNLLRRGDPSVYAAVSLNAAAERDAAAYLRAAPDGDRPLLTPTYNYAGVFDALGHGRVGAVQVQRLLDRCGGMGPGLDACLAGCWQSLLARPGATPLRVIMPIKAAAVDHPTDVIEGLERTLVAASAALGLSARLEQRFATAAGEPVIMLYRVDGTPKIALLPPRAEAPSAPPTGCAGGIDAATAQALFDKLATVDAGDGCKLDDVSTERSRVLVRWEKGGAATEPLLLVPVACADAAGVTVRGKVLALTVPPAAAAACPGAVARVRALVE